MSDSVVVTLPTWASDEVTLNYYSRGYSTDEDMMAVAIYISARNVEEGTGGPFGCAIFERDVSTGEAKLVSVGMNRVVPLGNSTLHGETVAIQMAQKKMGLFTLQIPNIDSDGQISVRRFELFTSTEPCAMCLGAILWSGVARVVCAATKDQASAIGMFCIIHYFYFILHSCKISQFSLFPDSYIKVSMKDLYFLKVMITCKSVESKLPKVY